MSETTGGERLGATVSADGTRFVVASGVADRIELCLFDLDGTETDHIDLAPAQVDAGGVQLWCGEVAGVGHGQRYGFRVHGPGDPAAGHACDPAKLLVDPAARLLTGELRWTKELTTPGVDSAPHVPRSVVVRPNGGVPVEDRPGTPWDLTAVYEAHVGHLTARHPLVAAERRGTYAGLAAPAVIDHLLRLGVTAVELLPVQQFVSEPGLVAGGKRNVWGYNPLGWSAPHAAYATNGGDPIAELRAAIAALHTAGIEVWLDVVYNHTCEGALGVGPIVSWRGFDNHAAYRLIPDAAGSGASLVDDDVTGCGNAIDTTSPWIRRLVRESLVGWVQEFGVDGFRFDLAATLVRGDNGPTHDHPLLAELAAEPALEGVKLVAEPWDIGLGGYLAGSFPNPWREWNDRFRDDIRELWRGDRGRWPDVARSITGSAELFRDPGRTASSSINAVATHDGFTVADLVTYDEPVGGGHDQRSWGGGLSGPTADATVLRNRARRTRCLLASVALAQGVPMIASGDELGRSQGGVADGYTLEPAEWGLPWPDADWDLVAWTAGALALRRSHAALRWDGWLDPSDPWLDWLDASGAPLGPDTWQDPALSAVQLHIRPTGTEPGAMRLLVLVAPTTAGERATFKVPEGTWVPVLDTDSLRPLDPATTHPVGSEVTIETPAILVLADHSRPAPRN